MAYLTLLLGIAVGIAMTGGLPWVASRGPVMLPVRVETRKRR